MRLEKNAAEVRINARLTGEDAERFRELQRSEGLSASDLLRDALREYHAARRKSQPSALASLVASGFIGSGAGPADLSVDYKRHLVDALAAKFAQNRVQDGE